jgi:N-acetylmuramoyl-L-alanine amidase
MMGLPQTISEFAKLRNCTRICGPWRLCRVDYSGLVKMRFASPNTSRAASLLTLALAAFAFSAVQADVVKPEDKPGFMRRIFGGGSKETPPPPPAPEEIEQAPKAKPATPGPKPKVTTIKPKSGSTAKSGSSTKKPSPAPATQKKAETPPAKKPEAPKAAEPEKKTATTETPMKAPSKGEGEFGTDDDDKQTAETKPVPAPRPEPSSPLPSSQSAGWKVVKINGRDYVTAESIHQFYRFSSYKLEGTHVWLRSNNLILKAQIGSQEMLINNIKFILSFPVLDSGGRALFSRLDLCKLIDPVLRPTYITDAEPFDTVVVDAGHGGHDAGARGVYGYEKDFALKMAATVKDALQRKGFKVILTRSTDTFITLGGRVAVANATPRSIFLSLHFNSGGSAASGIETFALTPQGSSASLERGGGYNYNGLTGNSHDSANIALATAVHAMVISRFKFVDRGIKRAQWSVLTGCKRPGILFEGGFVTNGNECRLIASDTYRQSVSSAIADAIVNYRTALRGAMTNRR